MDIRNISILAILFSNITLGCEFAKIEKDLIYGDHCGFQTLPRIWLVNLTDKSLKVELKETIKSSFDQQKKRTGKFEVNLKPQEKLFLNCGVQPLGTHRRLLSYEILNCR